MAVIFISLVYPVILNAMTNTQTPTRYATFYLIMLILTSIGIGFSTMSVLTGIPEVIRLMSFAQAFAICQIIGGVVTFISVPALIFLWLKKNPLGINLMLGSYAAVILVSVVSLFFLGPVIQDATSYALKDSPDLSPETMAMFTSFGMYAIYITFLIANVVMAILWWFAYRNQRRADSKEKAIPAGKVSKI